jgi:hypothetical protein
MTELTLAGLREAGYVTEEWQTWQQGHCGTYAVALIRAYPHLRFGTIGLTENGGGDASDGWRPAHHFAHDDTCAYDSAGRHQLPYYGVQPGTADYYELDGDPADEGLPDSEAGPEGSAAWLAAALLRARRNGILNHLAEQET